MKLILAIPILFLLFSCNPESKDETTTYPRGFSQFNGLVELNNDSYSFIDSENSAPYLIDEESVELLNKFAQELPDQKLLKQYSVEAAIYRSKSQIESNSEECSFHFTRIYESKNAENSSDNQRIPANVKANDIYDTYLRGYLNLALEKKGRNILSEQIHPDTDLTLIFSRIDLDSLLIGINEELKINLTVDSISSLNNWKVQLTSKLNEQHKELQSVDYCVFPANSSNSLLIKRSHSNFWNPSLNQPGIDNNVPAIQRWIVASDISTDSVFMSKLVLKSDDYQHYQLQGDWIFDRFADSTLRYTAGHSPVLHFDIFNTTLTGKNACNSIHLSYKLSGDSIAFISIAKTSNKCLVNGVVESQLLKTLSSAEKIRADDCYLELIKDEKVILVFRKSIRNHNP